MSAEFLFIVCNGLVIPGWLLLMLAPRWKWTARLISAVLFPLPLAALYVGLLVGHLGKAPGGFGSLAQVLLFFQNPYLLLAGWIHYLAFDLFIGSWEVRDAQRYGIPHLVVLPCLILTLLFGPAGLFLYFAARFALRRQLLVEP